MNAFKVWWEREGSGMRPEKGEDLEEFAKRITGIAWRNSAYLAKCNYDARINRNMLKGVEDAK